MVYKEIIKKWLKLVNYLLMSLEKWNTFRWGVVTSNFGISWRIKNYIQNGPGHEPGGGDGVLMEKAANTKYHDSVPLLYRTE